MTTTMKLKQAIQKAKRIETIIHVGEGYGHNVRISKKDALSACKSYLKDTPVDEHTNWENEEGSIIASVINWGEDGRIDNLSIGR